MNIDHIQRYVCVGVTSVYITTSLPLRVFKGLLENIKERNTGLNEKKTSVGATLRRTLLGGTYPVRRLINIITI